MDRPIRVLLAKPGLDGHDVGAKVVARALIEAGMEVVYTGLRKTPEEIVARVREEKADVIGLSILSGSHLPLCRRIRELLADSEVGNRLWIVGGNIPKRDHEALRAIGVDGIFQTGSSLDDIITFIRENVARWPSN